MEDRELENKSTEEDTEAQTEETPDANWFEQALETYDYERPRRGQLIEGMIIRLEDNAIIVDIGLKRDAVVPEKDLALLDQEMIKHLSVGDPINVIVTQLPGGDREMQVSISQALAVKSWENAEKLLAEGTPLELEVVEYNKGGVLVDFEGLRGFVPASHLVELRRMRSQQRIQQYKRSLIGSRLLVKVIEVDRKRRRLVFSALAAQEEQRQQRLRTLEEGQIFIQARVVSVVNFGVFVDLDGIDGLVHISELDWRKVKHPSELFKPGDEIDVKVIGIDVEKERVSLSRKALLPSPWTLLQEKYKPGSIVTGTVTRVLDFGAFVELPEDVVGLVHVSEIGYSAPGSPKEIVKEGDNVIVRIMDINAEKERVSLSMRRVPVEKQIAWLTENLADDSDREEEPSSTEPPEPIQPEDTASQPEAPSPEEEPAESEHPSDEPVADETIDSSTQASDDSADQDSPSPPIEGEDLTSTPKES